MSSGHGPGVLAGVRLTERWTRAYTRRLSPETAGSRRDEIAADMHDQLVADRARGCSAHAISRAISVRMLLGVPADLSWRHHQLRAQRSVAEKESAVNRTRTTPLLPLVAGLVVVAWTGFLSLDGLLRTRSQDGDVGWWTAPVVLGSAALAIVGFALLVAGKSAGGYLLAAASVNSTTWFIWILPAPVLGLLLAIYLVRSSRQARRASTAALTGMPLAS